jgi:hypothetical protein
MARAKSPTSPRLLPRAYIDGACLQLLRMGGVPPRRPYIFNPSSAFNFRVAAFIRGKKNTTTTTTQIAQFYVQPSSGFCWIPPVVRRLFEVNLEPHNGASPSVRLCVGLISISSLILVYA